MILIALLLIFSGFSGESIYADSLKGVTIHKRNSYFIDIEAPKDLVWVGCAGKSAKEKTAFMSFYILDGEKAWTFHYRRILKDSQCEEDSREFHKIMKNSKKVRIVGTQPIDEDGPEPKDKEIPEHFTNMKTKTFSTFIRLQADGKCKAYFEHHCELPKNYWGGTNPD